MLYYFLSDEGILYMFGSDYHGCLGSDQQFGDEVTVPLLVEFFREILVKQVSCGDCHVVALSGINVGGATDQVN